MNTLRLRRLAMRFLLSALFATSILGQASARAQVVQIHTSNGTDTSYYGIPLEIIIHLDARQFKWLEFIWIPLALHFDNGNFIGPIAEPAQAAFLPASQVFTSRAVGFPEATDPDTVSIYGLSFSSVFWTGAADFLKITVLPQDVGQVVFTEISLPPNGTLGAWVMDSNDVSGWVPVDWNAPTIVVEECPSDLMGDVNASTRITTADIIYLVSYIFKSGPLPMPVPLAGDVDCNRRVTSGDIVYLAAYIFRGGPVPCPCLFAY